VWGQNAARPPASDAEIFRDLNPAVSLVIFSRSALCPHEEEPSRFNQLALDFLKPPDIEIRMAA
jgi:pimeloyl-ACP methyl ester carboxylesterase